MSVIDSIRLELEDIKKELIAKYDEKGMRASGRFADNLNVVMSGISGAIFGEDYSEQLEKGRRPGGFPPISAIEQWIRDKRIQSEIKVSSLAFLIARKIAREGWDRQGYGGVNLISEVLTPARIEKIYNKFGKEITLEFAQYMNVLQAA
jgi:hypothetical protein